MTAELQLLLLVIARQNSLHLDSIGVQPPCHARQFQAWQCRKQHHDR